MLRSLCSHKPIPVPTTPPLQVLESEGAYKVSCGKCKNPLGHEFLKDGPDGEGSRWVRSPKHQVRFTGSPQKSHFLGLIVNKDKRVKESHFKGIGTYGEPYFFYIYPVQPRLKFVLNISFQVLNLQPFPQVCRQTWREAEPAVADGNQGTFTSR